jgi:hypothetical protein
MATAAKLLSLDDLRLEIARVGVSAEEVPANLPPSPEERWTLLAPYLGKPLSAIPKGLVFLFVLAADNAATPLHLAKAVRGLPTMDRMVSSSSSSGEDNFI